MIRDTDPSNAVHLQLHLLCMRDTAVYSSILILTAWGSLNVSPQALYMSIFCNSALFGMQPLWPGVKSTTTCSAEECHSHWAVMVGACPLNPSRLSKNIVYIILKPSRNAMSSSQFVVKIENACTHLKICIFAHFMYVILVCFPHII